MPYRPEAAEDRAELARTLVETLADKGFIEEYAEFSGERVFYRPVSDNVRIQVWTSVERGANIARSSGSDAVRVCAVYHGRKGDRGIASTVRVNRTGEIANIVDRVGLRVAEVRRAVEDHPKCDRCGAPTFLSKAGNNVCADICWERR